MRGRHGSHRLDYDQNEPDPIQVRSEDVEALRAFLHGMLIICLDKPPRNDKEHEMLAAATRLLADLGGPPGD